MTTPNQTGNREGETIETKSNLDLAVAALALLVSCTLSVAQVQPVRPDAKAKAEQVLRQMTDFYRDLKSFSFELRTEFSGTLAQDYEETMSLVSTYAVKVQRPDRVSMKLMTGTNILLGAFVTDGTNTYHQGFGTEIVNKRRPRDDGEGFPEGPYGFLTAKDPYRALRTQMVTLEYLGLEKLDGQPCHRFGSREKDGYRSELWVQAGAQPLLEQVVLLVPESERHAKGEPPHVFEDVSKTAWRFSNWKMNPTFTEGTFGIPKKNLTPTAGGGERSVPLDPSPAPTNRVLIPAGAFTMGDSLDGLALPLHTNEVSAFFMDQYEVTKALWNEVYGWALGHGYRFDSVGSGKAPNHPVQEVSWYDALKWCNARSEREGRVPAYYVDRPHTTVYRTGQTKVQNDWVKWNAGYRLPTEAEWEKAARGGASGRRFPWVDANTITHSRANCYSSTRYAYDISPTSGHHPGFQAGGEPYTNPVGYFAPNGYGLYDMAGNAWEWCWDWYGDYGSAAQRDPRGPATGSLRVFRGGGWSGDSGYCRSADRQGNNPTYATKASGFRSVLPPSQP